MSYEQHIRSRAKRLGFAVTGHPSRGYTITDRGGFGIVRGRTDTLDEVDQALDALVEFDRRRAEVKAS
jgi:hypothetical protein